MKRIFCMVLVMMLALSCISAFAATGTTYSSTTGNVEVELSVTLKSYFSWFVPGDDLDMQDGKIRWGNVGVTGGAKFSSGTKVYLYAASKNGFKLVHDEIPTSVIPYVMSVEGVTDDITGQPTSVMDGGRTAYYILETNRSEGTSATCYYEMDEKKPNDCGWYRDTVTFYCSVK